MLAKMARREPAAHCGNGELRFARDEAAPIVLHRGWFRNRSLLVEIEEIGP